MTGRNFILRIGCEHNRSIVHRALQEARNLIDAGFDVAITVVRWESKRSREQNRLMWALLSDLAEQKQWPVDGRLVHMEPEEWKDVMTAGLAKHQRVAAGIEGGFVMLGRRTSRMSVAEMGELIELIYAFGAEHGVKFREPPVLRELGKAE